MVIHQENDREETVGSPESWTLAEEKIIKQFARTQGDEVQWDKLFLLLPRRGVNQIRSKFFRMQTQGLLQKDKTKEKSKKKSQTTKEDKENSQNAEELMQILRRCFE